MEAVLLQYGLPGVCILALGIALVHQDRTYRSELKEERQKYERVQDQRLTEAKETRDKLSEPLEKVTDLSQRIYELLLTGKRER